MQINGHKISLTLVLSCAIASAGLLVWVGSIAGDNADTKRRLSVVEERQKEDRKDTKQAVKEIQQDVKETKENVNKILIKLEAQEQRETARRR